jgi:regulator of PEP synthase PpsR (kinase-PPPase family)
LKVIVLSGGSGRTAKQVAEAALAQFSQPNAEIVVHAGVRNAAAARRIVRQAEADGAIICHTLVAPKIRQTVVRETEALMVPAIDILGPLISLLSDQLFVEPRSQPGLSYELNKEQFDRIDAVDFSVTHDDGRRPEDYDQADVVLVGVSRVSKSVTCLFLACRGIRAANVAIAPGVEPPEELLAIDPRKVIALKMNAQRLQMLREARGERWKGAMQHYSDLQSIAWELREFDTLVAKEGWRCIDVSYKAVEDVAAEVAEMLGDQPTRRDRLSCESKKGG